MDKTYYSLDVYDNEGADSIDSESSENYVRIDYIVVAEEERGAGKGRELLRAAIAEAKTYGLPIYMVASELEESTDLGQLVDFYEEEGFSIVEVIGDSVLMEY